MTNYSISDSYKARGNEAGASVRGMLRAPRATRSAGLPGHAAAALSSLFLLSRGEGVGDCFVRRAPRGLGAAGLGEVAPAGLAALLPPLLPRALRLRGFLTVWSSIAPLAPFFLSATAAAAAACLRRQSRTAATSRLHSRQPRAVYRPMSRVACAAEAELLARAPSPPTGAPPLPGKRAEALGLRDAVMEGLQLSLLAALPSAPPGPGGGGIEELGGVTRPRACVGEALEWEAPTLSAGVGGGVMLGEALLAREGETAVSMLSVSVGEALGQGAGEGASMEDTTPADTEGELDRL